MKSRKTLIIAGAVLVVVLIAALVIIPRLIDPESYRDLVEEKARDALGGREVELGPMSLDLWPGIGLEVGGLKVHDLEKDQPMLLSAKSVVARVSLMPLLSKKLDVQSIEIDSPAINLVRLTPDKWNISDLAGSTAEKPAPEPTTADKEKGEAETESMAERLAIKGISIRDGRITVEDKTGASPKPLEVLIDSLELSDIVAGKPAKVKLAAALGDGSGRIKSEGLIGPLTGEGAKDKFMASMSTDLEGFDLPSVLAWLPPDSLPIKVIAGTLSGKIDLDGKAGAPIKVNTDLTTRAFKYDGADGTWGENEPADVTLSASGGYDPSSGALDIGSATLTLPAGKIDLKLSQKKSGEDASDMTATVKSGGLDIPKLLAFAPVAGKPLHEAGMVTSGPLMVDLTYHAKPDKTATLKAVADLTQAYISVPDSFRKAAGKAGKLSTDANLDEAKISLTNTALALGPMVFKGGGTIMRDENMTTEINLESGAASTAEAKALFPSLDDYNLGGTVALALKVAGQLKKTETITINILRLRQDSEDAKFTLSGLVRLTKPLEVIFQLDSEILNLDKLMAPSSNKPEDAKAGKDAGKAGDKTGKDKADSSDSGFKLDGKVKAAKIIYEGMEITNLSAEPRMAKNVLTIPDLKLTAYDSPVHGPVKLDLSGKKVSGDVGVAAEGIPIDSLIRKFTNFPTVVTGSAFGDVALGFNGTDTASLQKTASGKGRVELKKGVLRGVDLVDGLLSQWAASDSVKTLVRDSLGPALNRNIADETPFKDLSTNLKVKDGKLLFDKAVMEIEEGQVLMDGAVGLDRSVDLLGRLKLSKTATEAIMKTARSWVEKQTGGAVKGTILDALLEDGRLILPFRLSGIWPKPMLTMDSKAYSKTVEKNLQNQTADKIIEQVIGEDQKKEVDKKVDEQKKKIEEDVKKKAEDALGEDGKKLLEGIFPKQ